MAFRPQAPTVSHIDEGYGREYSAKHTETTSYEHPKGIAPFTHVHEDGRDYEDVYRYETVTVGDITIRYSYDCGNRFVTEYINIKQNDAEICYVERSHGAIDPLKIQLRKREEGQKMFKKIAEDFGVDSKQLAKTFAGSFRMNAECLALIE